VAFVTIGGAIPAAQLIAAHHDAKADAALIDQSIASLN
jgi:hypothetical protein